MLSEAIDKIVELSSLMIQEVDGYEYLVNTSGAHLVRPPAVQTVNCFSLTQMISFLKFQTDQATGIAINPINHQVVEAFVLKINSVNAYEVVARSDFRSVLQDFPSGEMFTQEELMIKLQSGFAATPSREDLLKLVSAVHEGRMRDSVDDGVSQVVSTKAGVHLRAEVAVKNPWHLRPFKSFPEIYPVEVPYILRLHQRADEMPKFSLHEADGGAWKVETTKVVRRFLQDAIVEAEIKNVTVL